MIFFWPFHAIPPQKKCARMIGTACSMGFMENADAKRRRLVRAPKRVVSAVGFKPWEILWGNSLFKLH